MLFGGRYNPTSCYLFSTLSQQWTKLQDIPWKRYYHGSAVIGSSVFLVGSPGNSFIDEYNIVTKAFTHLYSLNRSFFSSPIFRNRFGLCIYKGNSLLIAGGKNDNGETTNNCFVFKTKTKAISYVGSLTKETQQNVLVNFKGEIFCISGWNPTDKYLNLIEVFDETTKKWKTTSLKLNIARKNHQAVAHKQFIYVLGGSNNGGLLDTIERIDVSAGKVEILNVKLKYGRSWFATTKVCNDLYIFGGQVDGNSYDYKSTYSTEVLDLETLEIKEGVELPIIDQFFTACS